MEDILFTPLISVLCSALSSGITFLLTRRKYSAEVDSQRIKNYRDAFEVNKQIMENSIQVLSERVKSLEEENNNLRQQVRTLELQVIDILKLKVGFSEPKNKGRKKDGNISGKKI